jgi:KUP system potassium uptake protein
LAIGCLGVLFGDIGTSPLYTIRECFRGKHAIALTPENLFGVMALIFWSLTIVVSVKYVSFILRADNHGEGGIFSLLGLVSNESKKLSPRLRSIAVGGGILGPGLLAGEGIITPAISVLSSVEGLEVATKAASPFILPIACLIIFMLFFFQHRGTANIGKLFGPIMALWFLAIAVLGLAAVVRAPQILLAVNPLYAYHFFVTNKFQSFVVFGSVVLCITGCEALYADLGHFGKRAIQFSWLGLVFPSLLSSYFGQTALLLKYPEMAFNPFYSLVLKFFLYPMVALATIATVIASQSLISGVFSLTQQAIDLGYFPRFHIVHTSYEIKGQIYVPAVNYALMVACLAVVIGFRESTEIAAAYGLAVTRTMNITSTLFFILSTRGWSWPVWKAAPLVILFLLFDSSYFLANLLKIVDGGWVTLFIAGLITIALTTWRKGRSELYRKIGTRLPIKAFLEYFSRHDILRVKGTAVFLSINPEGTSPVLLQHLKHTKVLPKKVVLLSLMTANIPRVKLVDRVKVENLGQGFYSVVAYNGYMQKPSIPEVMKMVDTQGLEINLAETIFYLGRVNLFTHGDSKMAPWRKSLFAFMSRVAGSPTAYFDLLADMVVELGAQVQL